MAESPMATFLLPEVLFSKALFPFEVFAANSDVDEASIIKAIYFMTTL
ncbi:hypothetical protein CRYPA_1358 [uncultured Candidatus Thioglobus sp.]|nr:hypothetical protein CRYPA_1358 [uncultured Candidatus Thioglobus sp.]